MSCTDTRRSQGAAASSSVSQWRSQGFTKRNQIIISFIYTLGHCSCCHMLNLKGKKCVVFFWTESFVLHLALMREPKEKKKRGGGWGWMLIEIHEACKVSHLPQMWFRLCNWEKGGVDRRYYSTLLKYVISQLIKNMHRCGLFFKTVRPHKMTFKGPIIYPMSYLF